MIVDGICIQFLGCFDCHTKNRDYSDIQQINGVGRVQLDEDYYRELSSTQVCLNEKKRKFENLKFLLFFCRFSPKKSKLKFNFF